MNLPEDAVPANAVGSGGVQGIGIGTKGEPGVNPKKKAILVDTLRRKPISEETFAGHPVFIVDSSYFHHCRNSKLRYHRWESYVGNCPIGQYIKEYGQSNPGTPIIIKDSITGAYCFLKYGNGKNRFI